MGRSEQWDAAGGQETNTQVADGQGSTGQSGIPPQRTLGEANALARPSATERQGAVERPNRARAAKGAGRRPSAEPRQTLSSEETGGFNRVQKMVGGTVLVILVCLVLVLGLSMTQKNTARTVPTAVKITASTLSLDNRSGRLTWTGIVTNESRTSQTAPWVRVTLYDPAGDSVDSGDATASEGTIRAGGALSYTDTFNTRGMNMRAIPVLEGANVRSLGM